MTDFDKTRQTVNEAVQYKNERNGAVREEIFLWKRFEPSNNEEAIDLLEEELEALEKERDLYEDPDFYGEWKARVEAALEYLEFNDIFY